MNKKNFSFKRYRVTGWNKIRYSFVPNIQPIIFMGILFAKSLGKYYFGEWWGKKIKKEQKTRE